MMRMKRVRVIIVSTEIAQDDFQGYGATSVLLMIY